MVSEIEIAVIQPRAFHPDGPTRRETISSVHALEYLDQLFDAMRRTMEADAPLVAGSHCRFCRAASICRALEAKAGSVVGIDFTGPAITVPRNPDTLPLSAIGTILDQADVVKNWISAIESRAVAEILAGNTVPGWKLVARRAMRKWSDEDGAAQALQSAGMADNDIFNKKIITPTQAEKLLGKDKKAAMKGFIVTESSGSTLAPITDRRPALPSSAVADFTTLTEEVTHHV